MHTQYRAKTAASPLDSSPTPPTSGHVGMSSPTTAAAHISHATGRESSTMPFPSEKHVSSAGKSHTRGSRVPSPEYWDGKSEVLPQRTVRRKKSSFDLRDVFKRGASPPQKNML
ncbi:hypothetical protein BC629DRAFT_15745 [Irpex lacteus]|nr:hypothetical protein BC629DRAFT_15745 [Irpex lacteus]